MTIDQRKELTMIGFCATIGTAVAIELFSSGVMFGLTAYAAAKEAIKVTNGACHLTYST